MTTKLIVITGFLVSFAAGMMVGVRQRMEPPKPAVVISIPTTGPSTQPGRDGRGPRGNRTAPSSIIARELALSPEQTQKMNNIFRKAADAGHDLDEQRRTLRQKRDDDIRELAKIEENDKYEKILKGYNEASEKITEDWRSTYTSAVEQTKQILNEDQRKRYEEILTRNRWDGRGSEWPWPWGQNDGRGGRGGPPGGGRGGPRDGGERRSNSQNQDNRDNNGRPGADRATSKPVS